MTKDGMVRLGNKHGGEYWFNPRDLYVYRWKDDGTFVGWIAHISVWERWAWKLD